jgi:hypothetical protein
MQLGLLLQACILRACVLQGRDLRKPFRTTDQRDGTIASAQPESSSSLQLFVTMCRSYAR